MIKQSSSKHRAVRAHVMHVYFECICWMFARCLFDRVNKVLGQVFSTIRHLSVCRPFVTHVDKRHVVGGRRWHC